MPTSIRERCSLSRRAVTVKVRGGLHACRPRGRRTAVANLRLWLPQAAPPHPPLGSRRDAHGWPVPVPLMKAAAPRLPDVAPAQRHRSHQRRLGDFRRNLIRWRSKDGLLNKSGPCLPGRVLAWPNNGERSGESRPIHAARFARLPLPDWVGSSSGTRGMRNPPAIRLSARDALTCFASNR